MTTPLKQLDKALGALRDLGLIKSQPEEAPVVALIDRIAHLDPDKTVAIARTLSQASLFNEVVREHISAMSIGERYRGITESFNTIRDDAKAMVAQVEDGKIDTMERLSNIWMKVTRGDIPSRFARIKDSYLDVAKDAKEQIQREQSILDAYRDFRGALKESQVLGFNVLKKAEESLAAARTALQAASDAVNASNGSDREAHAKLEMARDVAMRALQDEDKRYQIAKDLAENLSISYNTTEVVMARLMQITDAKERVYSQAVMFFGTNETVFTALSASFTGMHGLHESTQTLDAMKKGMNDSLETLGEVGTKVLEEATRAGYGPTLRAESVAKLVDAVVSFQERSVQIIDEMRDLSTANEREIQAAVEDGKQRLVALGRSAATLPAPRQARTMNTPLPAAVPAPGQPRTSMDELMLAMDIVDTLRHEQSLVERELASEARDDAFVGRVKQIYANQGIEVSDALVRQGVEALKQDRFAYTPPKRTLAVRLAEVWVDRWRWTKRAMIVGFLGAFGYGIVALPNAWMAAREYRGYVGAVQEMQSSAAKLRRRDELLAARVAAWTTAPELVAMPVANAADTINAGRVALAPQIAGLGVIEAVDADTFGAAPQVANEALGVPLDTLDAVDRRLKALETDAARAEDLVDGANRFAQIDARFAGLALGEAAQERVTAQQAQARAALASGDSATAKTALTALEQAAAQVNLAYTLRIVNREGVQSGVWRHHQDAPDGKNYYLVVEAIDAGGRVVALPVINEETQRSESVALFALRVPQAEYEKVKADKLDNGLIDDAVVGEKRRGELEVDYRVAVSGGAITAW